MNALIRLGCSTICVLQCYFAPILDLIIRLWMAKIFFYSGLTKYANMDIAVALFREEYKVPLIDPAVAAYMATATELIAPVMLVAGLGARAAATAMFVMTLVIQFTYLDLQEHFYWMMLLGIIILKGPGAISIDRFLAPVLCPRSRR
ncbi:MAG: DoxX family protein [Alphaproteobacteria bacterium]